MRYIIVGNSTAGINCAETIKSIDRQGEITILTHEKYHLYSRCLLTHYLADTLSYDRLFIKDKQWYNKLSIKPLFGKTVTKLNATKKQICLDSGETIGFDKLLIASGGHPICLNLPCADANGIFTLRTLEDAKRIKRFCQQYRVKSAAILGAGFVGLKTAVALTKQNIKTTIIEKLNCLMPRMMDDTGSAILQKHFVDNKINVKLATEANSFTLNKKGLVNGINLRNGKNIPTQMVIISVGVRPNIEFIKGSGIKTKHGIITDDYLQTNIKDIFAAGDVAETTDLITGQKTINALWSAASTQGRIAGVNMTGQTKRYPGSLPMNSVELFGLPIISFGYVCPIIRNDPKKTLQTRLRREGKDYQVIKRKNTRPQTYQKLVFKNNRLVGAIFIGQEQIKHAGVFLALLKSKEIIAEPKKNLFTNPWRYSDKLLGSIPQSLMQYA
ncbi:NAD(P)/FAD-dependent oxidoreductase [Planctomycetota bacterium]